MQSIIFGKLWLTLTWDVFKLWYTTAGMPSKLRLTLTWDVFKFNVITS